jgi:hypothetical protein
VADVKIPRLTLGGGREARRVTTPIALSAPRTTGTGTVQRMSPTWVWMQVAVVVFVVIGIVIAAIKLWA